MMWAVIILLVVGVALGQDNTPPVNCAVYDYTGQYVHFPVGDYAYTNDMYVVGCYEGAVMRRIECLDDNYERSTRWISQVIARMECKQYHATENNVRTVIHVERKIVGCLWNGKSYELDDDIFERGRSGFGFRRKCQLTTKSDHEGGTIEELSIPYLHCIVFPDIDAPDDCHMRRDMHMACVGVHHWVKPGCARQLTTRRIFECARRADGGMQWRTRSNARRKYPFC